MVCLEVTSSMETYTANKDERTTEKTGRKQQQRGPLPRQEGLGRQEGRRPGVWTAAKNNKHCTSTRDLEEQCEPVRHTFPTPRSIKRYHSRVTSLILKLFQFNRSHLKSSFAAISSSSLQWSNVRAEPIGLLWSKIPWKHVTSASTFRMVPKWSSVWSPQIEDLAESKSNSVIIVFAVGSRGSSLTETLSGTNIFHRKKSSPRLWDENLVGLGKMSTVSSCGKSLTMRSRVGD